MPIYSNRLGFSVGEEVYNFSVMSKQIIETVFQVNKICEKVRCEKIRTEENDPLESEKFYIVSSWILFIIGIVILVLGFHYKDLKSTLTTIGIVFIVMPTLISLIIVFVSINRKPKLINLEKECHLKMMEFLQFQNRSYQKRGLKWSVGDEILWLELNKI